jgi:thiamine kinase-like enzyme
MPTPQVNNLNKPLELQSPKEALAKLISDKLPTLYPEVFVTRPRVEIFEGAGMSGCFFKATSDGGQSYFIKCRGINTPDISPEIQKEINVTRMASNAGVSVTQIYKPTVIPINEMPDSILKLDTFAVKGKSQPLMLNLQAFVTGLPAHESIREHDFQKQIYFNLGREIQKLHQIQVDGFGSNFQFSYQDFLGKFEVRSKAEDLQRLEVLDNMGVLKVQALLLPLKNLSNPTAVLNHTDLNPGNFIHNSNGTIASIIDWETAEGAPWQLDVALTLNKIEASMHRIYVPYRERIERAQSFLDGYGLSGDRLEQEMPVINAFRIAKIVEFLNLLHINYKYPYIAVERESVINDSYNGDSSTFYQQQDIKLGILQHHEMLSRLISD